MNLMYLKQLERIRTMMGSHWLDLFDERMDTLLKEIPHKETVQIFDTLQQATHVSHRDPTAIQRVQERFKNICAG